MTEKFIFTQQPLPGVLAVLPKRFGDERGYFVETYTARSLQAHGVDVTFIQDNHSLSRAAGVVRGLHFQNPPMAQAKLVRAVRGSVFDVAVDLREGSPHYGKWCGMILTAERGEQYYIPAGFAHGFCTLEAHTEFVYKVDNYYAPECDAGLRWDDPDIGISWPIDKQAALVSARDEKLPFLRDFKPQFVYGS